MPHEAAIGPDFTPRDAGRSDEVWRGLRLDIFSGKYYRFLDDFGLAVEF